MLDGGATSGGGGGTDQFHRRVANWLAEAKPGDELPNLVVNPKRPGRVEPPGEEATADSAVSVA